MIRRRTIVPRAPAVDFVASRRGNVGSRPVVTRFLRFIFQSPLRFSHRWGTALRHCTESCGGRAGFARSLPPNVRSLRAFSRLERAFGNWRVSGQSRTPRPRVHLPKWQFFKFHGLLADSRDQVAAPRLRQLPDLTFFMNLRTAANFREVRESGSRRERRVGSFRETPGGEDESPGFGELLSKSRRVGGRGTSGQLGPRLLVPAARKPAAAIGAAEIKIRTQSN